MLSESCPTPVYIQRYYPFSLLLSGFVFLFGQTWRMGGWEYDGEVEMWTAITSDPSQLNIVRKERTPKKKVSLRQRSLKTQRTIHGCWLWFYSGRVNQTQLFKIVSLVYINLTPVKHWENWSINKIVLKNSSFDHFCNSVFIINQQEVSFFSNLYVNSSPNRKSLYGAIFTLLFQMKLQGSKTKLRCSFRSGCFKLSACKR